MRRILTILWSVLFLHACVEDKSNGPLFDLKENAQIGVDFENTLSYSREFNVYKYRNFYNGGGVSIGDVNNDGLVDVYLTANQLPNKLYLNKGNWKFEDISATAGVEGEKAWSTGVSMVDINADGLLDIYVCNSGDVKGDNKENELFINNGDLTFTESAAQYNLNDKGFSTHASFFDYDKDGDLDVYILNNSFQAIGSFNLKKNERPVRDELGGDKLMENRNGTFVDVSEEAGIYGSVIGFGLGVTVGDVNNDNWDDIFVSNDFFERDYLYINQQDGTFKEDLVQQMNSISGASMGADLGDIDNDGFNDIFVTEMLPSEYERLKTVTTFEDWDKYQYNVQNGYHHQFTRNTLHRNNGNDTYSEVSRLAGVEASDWSWGALFFDMDNDGLKDLFIANGIYRDLTNQDYLQYVANESVMRSVIQDSGVNYKELIDIIPSNKVANQAYLNKGNLEFELGTSTGLLTPSFSNGSAYGDLDNDGDLDLVVNNVNMPCFFYENQRDKKPGGNYLKLELEGEGQNKFAQGAKIEVKTAIAEFILDNQSTRGFQSSMDTRAHLGLGEALEADIIITWPSGKVSRLSGVAANQVIKVKEAEAKAEVQSEDVQDRKPLLRLVKEDTVYVHQENRFVDFNRERLIHHMMSTAGPCISKGDLNGDQSDDILIPGPKGSLTTIISGDSSFSFDSANFESLKGAEHVSCELLDVDGDNDLDIYLASGGVEITSFSELMYDRIWINDGKGHFSLSEQSLPKTDYRMSTGTVSSGDIDGDGDLDLFVGERVKIGQYGQSCSGFILINDGKGNYSDQSEQIAPDLKDVGMITDSEWVDFDGDGDVDLLVVGEFMDILVFENEDGILKSRAQRRKWNGWWNVVEILDVDGDGDQDFIAGNHGLNSRFRASLEAPVRLYFNDYDKNSFAEGILTKTRADGKDYPYALRHNLVMQLSKLKKKFPDFESYKNASITEIFDPQILAETEILQAVEFKSMVFINEGNFEFSARPLPKSTQSSPMYAIAHLDIDKDGDQDVLMGGNLYGVTPEMGRYDASYGHLLINDGRGDFKDQAVENGFSIHGEIRDFAVMENRIYVFRNNDTVLTFELNQ